MQPIPLIELATKKAEWLALRQSVVAENIANASTPNYRARDIAPFAKVFEAAGLTMAKTVSGHLNVTPSEVGTAEIHETDTWGISHSGNSVALEQELMKSGDINRQYSLGAGIVKAFHRMILASTRSQP